MRKAEVITVITVAITAEGTTPQGTMVEGIMLTVTEAITAGEVVHTSTDPSACTSMHPSISTTS
jgi:hypothetical protein